MDYPSSTTLGKVNRMNPAYFEDAGSQDDAEMTQTPDAFRRKSQKVLLSISAVFPFDFFPDKLTIDENKINVVMHQFFWSWHLESIDIKNIKDVCVETIPFFGTLKIIIDQYYDNPLTIRFLKKHEAIEARKLIQGLKSMQLNNVTLPTQDLYAQKNLIMDIGKTAIYD